MLRALLIATAWLVVAGPVQARAEAPAPARTLKLYSFFATWCVPCRVELPYIERLHRKYSPEGLRITLVSEDAPSTATEIPAFLARYGVTMPWIRDQDSELLVRYHPSASVPFVVLLDEKDTVLFAQAGYEPGDEHVLEARILQWLRPPAELAPTATPKAQPRASAPELQVTLQSQGIYRSNEFDPTLEGKVGGVRSRLESTVRTQHLTASARVDGTLLDYVDNSGVRGRDDIEDIRVERAQVDANYGSLRARLGDSYLAIGHGMTLSLRRVDPLGQDTALRGGRLDMKLGERIRVMGLGGLVNRQNFDPIAFESLGELDDWIAGAELSATLFEGFKIAPYALMARAFGPGDAPRREWRLYGASLQLRRDALTWKAEAAGGRREGFALKDETPVGVFSSVSFNLGPTTTLIEAKYYRHWFLGRQERQLAYHEPLTLERDDQQIPGNEDSVGGRLRLELRALSWLNLYVNGMYYRVQTDDADPLDGGDTIHAYAGGDLRPIEGLSVAVAAGYRDEDKPGGDPRLELWHVDFDAAWSVTPKLAMTAKLNHVSETKHLVRARDFVRGIAVVGAAIPATASLAFVYGYSTESDANPTHYPGAEFRWLLAKGGEIRLFGGRLVGGRVCVNGSCRDVVPFEGVRLETVLRY